MNKEEKAIYTAIIKFLDKRSLELEVDKFGLEILAKAFVAYNKTSDFISKMDLSKPDKGFSQTNTYLLYKQSIDTIYKFSDKFGLNPTAREKIKAFKVEKVEQDELSDL